jgi:hypothetical protein
MAAATAGAIFEIDDVCASLADKELQDRPLSKLACEDSLRYLSFQWNGTIWNRTSLCRAFPQRGFQSPAAPATRRQGFSLTLPGIEWQLAKADTPVTMGSLNRKANT